MAENDDPESPERLPKPIESNAGSDRDVFKERLSEILRESLKDPSQATNISRKVISLAASSYQGPIPPPELLAGFDAVVPGSASQIVNMAVLEQRHRHNMEKKEMSYPFWGLFAGFLVAALCVGGSIFLAINHEESVAGGLLGLPALGVVGWFVKSRVFRANPLPSSPSVQKKRAKKR